MASVELAKPTSFSCSQSLEKAKMILANDRNWSISRQEDVLVLLKSVVVLMRFDFVLPVNNQMKPAFLQRVGTRSDDWIRCPDC